ncbi:MAG: PadR family transcriptional regulator [Candidatus Altiarchaeales archaeon ex4484_2]|nr:MAG: PadR family transcriptional regulator [Candidatus Altiarchaeales archaeon ex4484_2]
MALYVLHSLDKKPKSGYDIIKEIKEKTDGLWVPSKGAVYPTLDQLEREGLIKVKKIDKRSKKVLELTVQGRRRLNHIREHRKVPKEKMQCFRNLFVEIFGSEKIGLHDLLFEIKNTVDELPPERKAETEELLRKCLTGLEEIK